MLSADQIREEAGDQSTEPRTAGHGSGDAALDIGVGPRADPLAVLIVDVILGEVAEVGFGADDCGHGRDVETKQTTADHGDGRDDIDVAHGHGDCYAVPSVTIPDRRSPAD